MAKKEGPWFTGNIFMMSSSDMAKMRKYSEGVMKPTALRTKTVKGKTYSQYYYKPIGVNEFWD